MSIGVGIIINAQIKLENTTHLPTITEIVITLCLFSFLGWPGAMPSYFENLIVLKEIILPTLF